MIRLSLFVIFILFVCFFSWWRVLISFFLVSFYRSLYCYSSIGIPFISLNVIMDRLSWCLVILSIWISAMSLLGSQRIYLNNQKKVLFLLIVTFLMVFLLFSFISSELVMFYFFFERRLLPILFIVLLWGYQPERLQAGLYIIIYTVFGSLPLLVRIMLIYFECGHGRIFLLGGFVRFDYGLWYLLLIIAFLIKLPLYGVHLWLPKAHVEAPVAGSMMLAGVLLKLGAYGLFRVISFSPEIVCEWRWLFIPISLLGASVTRFLCLRQSDFKSLIAYSSVAHIGLLVGGIFSYSVWGWQGALLISVAHGLVSSALFILANLVYLTSWSRSLFIVKGLQNLFPFIAFWWFIFCIINIAAPPFLRLLREIMLIRRIVVKSSVRILFLSVLRFLSAGYSLFLFVALQHGHINRLRNPLLLLSSSSFLGLFLHFVPVLLLVLNPIIISL